MSWKLYLLLKLFSITALPNPDSETLTELDKVWKNCQHLKPQPLTVMSSLLRNQDDVRNI